MLTTGILDPERETSLDEVLATLELPVQGFQAELRPGGSAEVIDLGVNGVRVTLMPTVSSRAERSPDPRESTIFLELAEQVFDRFKPQVLLTYGGHPASLELMRQARWVAGAENAPAAPALEQPVALLCCRYAFTPATHDAGVKPERNGDELKTPLGAGSSRRAAAQVGQAVHAQTIGDFPQPGSAGGEEAAQQPPRGQLLQSRLPVLGVAPEPLEDPVQLSGDQGFARAEQPPGVLHQEQVMPSEKPSVMPSRAESSRRRPSTGQSHSPPSRPAATVEPATLPSWTMHILIIYRSKPSESSLLCMSLSLSFCHFPTHRSEALRVTRPEAVGLARTNGSHRSHSAEGCGEQVAAILDDLPKCILAQQKLVLIDPLKPRR